MTVVGRTGREYASVPLQRLSPALVLAGAALLRFWALGHGIPYAVAADEPQIMERVVRMMKTGDLNPHFFHYPGLYFYVQLVVASLRFLAGAASGLWASLEPVSAADFYLWGRAVSATLGTATVWIVYDVARRWGGGYALLAAALMAVVPQHVRESHYVLTDVPLTFFSTLTLLLALQARERPSTRAFAWSGVAAGLAAASKYPGIVAVMFPLVAAATTSNAAGLWRLRAASTAAGGAAGTFLMAAPYAWLDLPAFLNDFAYLSSYYPPAGMANWRLYLAYLQLGLGWPGFVLMVAGLAVAAARAIRGPDRAVWWIVLPFSAAYFLLLSSRSRAFGRYLLPLYPIVCLLVAQAVVSGARILRRLGSSPHLHRALAGALVAVVFVPPAWSSIWFDRRISKPSTQSLAYAWFLENVPSGAAVVLEGQALWLPTGRYRVTHVRRLIDKPLDAYRTEGTQYLVASSEVYGGIFANPEGYPREYAAYRRLFALRAPLAMFSETREHPGPELRVYALDHLPDVGR